MDHGQVLCILASSLACSWISSGMMSSSSPLSIGDCAKLNVKTRSNTRKANKQHTQRLSAEDQHSQPRSRYSGHLLHIVYVSSCSMCARRNAWYSGPFQTSPNEPRSRMLVMRCASESALMQHGVRTPSVEMKPDRKGHMQFPSRG